MIKMRINVIHAIQIITSMILPIYAPKIVLPNISIISLKRKIKTIFIFVMNAQNLIALLARIMRTMTQKIPIKIRRFYVF